MSAFIPNPGLTREEAEALRGALVYALGDADFTASRSNPLHLAADEKLRKALAAPSVHLDLTAIEQAIWKAYADHHPIEDPDPDHWPEWLIAAALAVHELRASPQPETSGAAADWERLGSEAVPVIDAVFKYMEESGLAETSIKLYEAIKPLAEVRARLMGALLVGAEVREVPENSGESLQALAPHEIRCRCDQGGVFHYRQHTEDCPRREVGEMLAAVKRNSDSQGPYYYGCPKCLSGRHATPCFRCGCTDRPVKIPADAAPVVRAAFSGQPENGMPENSLPLGPKCFAARAAQAENSGGVEEGLRERAKAAGAKAKEYERKGQAKAAACTHGEAHAYAAAADLVAAASLPTSRGEEGWHEVWVRRDPITEKLHSTTGSTELSLIPPVEAIRNGARVYVPAPTQPQLSDEDRERLGSIAANIEHHIEEGHLNADFGARDARFLRKLASQSVEGEQP